MKFQAAINIMPLREVPDPQGENALKVLTNAGFSSLSKMKTGKHISLVVESEDEAQASQMITEACNYLLVNPVCEGFEFTLKEIMVNKSLIEKMPQE